MYAGTILWIVFVLVLVVQILLLLKGRKKSSAHMLDSARRELVRLRNGSQSYWEPTQIDEALKAGWSFFAIGTTEEELAEFRCGKSKRIYAEKWLARYRCGETGSIVNLVAYLVAEGIKPEDVGTSQQELKVLLREENRKFLSERLCLLRNAAAASIDFCMDPDMVCAELFEGRRIDISLEELGTTQEELVSLQKLAWLNQAKVWWRHHKEGIEGGSFCILDFSRLFEMLRKAGAGIADLGISLADLSILKRKNYLLFAKSTLETLRQRVWFLPISGYYTDMGKDVVLPGDPVPYVQRLRLQLSKARASLEDIDSSQEEIDSLMVPAYVYSATFLLFWTRKLVQRRAEGCSSNSEIFRNVAAIRAFLEMAEKKPEDIGTSQEELQALAAVPATC